MWLNRYQVCVEGRPLVVCEMRARTRMSRSLSRVSLDVCETRSRSNEPVSRETVSEIEIRSITERLVKTKFARTNVPKGNSARDSGSLRLEIPKSVKTFKNQRALGLKFCKSCKLLGLRHIDVNAMRKSSCRKEIQIYDPYSCGQMQNCRRPSEIHASAYAKQLHSRHVATSKAQNTLRCNEIHARLIPKTFQSNDMRKPVIQNTLQSRQIREEAVLRGFACLLAELTLPQGYADEKLPAAARGQGTLAKAEIAMPQVDTTIKGGSSHE